MTPTEAANQWSAAHPDGEPMPRCAGRCLWSEWEFNALGDCEYRICARCGGMEQQWIE